MKLIEYRALKLRSADGGSLLPDVIDVVEMVMEPNKVMKLQEIVDAAHIKTEIDKTDLQSAVSGVLKTLEKNKKVSHVGTGLWQRN